MAPSELTHTLRILDDRLKTAYTVAASLLLFAIAAVVAAFAVRSVSPRMAGTSAALAVIGGIGAVIATRVLVWKRTEVYDEIVLAGFRHVGGTGAARYAAEMVSPARRRMLAGTLERFLEVALGNTLASVPLDRHSLRDLEADIRGLIARVRAVDVEVEAAGMVLLHRLVTDGSTSPLFKVLGETRDLERAIDTIHAQLGPMPVIQLFPAATTEPLRLAA
jgi:hypothetical protein